MSCFAREETEKQQLSTTFYAACFSSNQNVKTFPMGGLWVTWSLPPLPPKLIWASIFFSKTFNSSTISVTMVGRGDAEPQACHSCNVIGGPPLLIRVSLGSEVEAHLELWPSGPLTTESIGVLVEKARDGERLNVGAKALKVENMVDFCLRISKQRDTAPYHQLHFSSHCRFLHWHQIGPSL